MKRKYVGAALIALIAVLAIALFIMDRKSAVQAAATQIPKFEVDPCGRNLCRIIGSWAT